MKPITLKHSLVKLVCFNFIHHHHNHLDLGFKQKTFYLPPPCRLIPTSAFLEVSSPGVWRLRNTARWNSSTRGALPIMSTTSDSRSQPVAPNSDPAGRGKAAAAAAATATTTAMRQQLASPSALT